MQLTIIDSQHISNDVNEKQRRQFSVLFLLLNYRVNIYYSFFLFVKES